MSTVMNSWLPSHRITVEEFLRMDEAGLLAPDSRVELIEGEIVDLPGIGSPHAAKVVQLNRILLRALGDHACVRVQAPLQLGLHSLPQPDLALVKSRKDFYASGHPVPADALLVVEVSDTTLRYDREIKVPLYARHGVPETWIVDINKNRLHCFRAPRDGRYTTALVAPEVEINTLAVLPNVAFDLSGLFR